MGKRYVRERFSTGKVGWRASKFRALGEYDSHKLKPYGIRLGKFRNKQTLQRKFKRSAFAR